MKKSIILIATFLLIYHVKAQSVHFGIKGGLNASSLNYDGNSEMQTKIGFNAGLFAHIHTKNKFWAIQPEIYYSAEGAKNKNDDDISTNLGFINIPVLIQYMFDNGFRLEAGPQVNFLVSAKSKDNNVSIDIKKDLKGADFSIPFGLSYIAMTGLGFDARYNFGISNIYKSDNIKVRSNVFQFDIFYQFSRSE